MARTLLSLVRVYALMVNLGPVSAITARENVLSYSVRLTP
ncbi:hypothetical protein VRRI112168_16615 [Vreelandella rituensis]